MQKLIKKLSFCALFALVFCLISQSAWAVPAHGGLREFVQPNGDSIKISTRGDEWFNWRENTKREIILFNRGSGYMEYATLKMENGSKTLIPSGIFVSENGLSSDKAMQKGTEFQFVAPTNNDLKEIWKSKASKKNFSTPYKRTK